MRDLSSYVGAVRHISFLTLVGLSVYIARAHYGVVIISMDELGLPRYMLLPAWACLLRRIDCFTFNDRHRIFHARVKTPPKQQHARYRPTGHVHCIIHYILIHPLYTTNAGLFESHCRNTFLLNMRLYYYYDHIKENGDTYRMGDNNNATQNI